MILFIDPAPVLTSPLLTIGRSISHFFSVIGPFFFLDFLLKLIKPHIPSVYFFQYDPAIVWGTIFMIDTLVYEMASMMKWSLNGIG